MLQQSSGIMLVRMSNAGNQACWVSLIQNPDHMAHAHSCLKLNVPEAG